MKKNKDHGDGSDTQGAVTEEGRGAKSQIDRDTSVLGFDPFCPASCPG